MTKLFWASITLSLAGCGAISAQSVYEGLRTQQSVNNAGAPQPVEKMGSYDAYEKEREKLKPEE